MLYTADFETTTDPNDCRVWAWGVCEIGNPDNFVYGNSIESFFDFMTSISGSTLYFHNLKFDASFLYNYMFENGYRHVQSRKEEESRTFSTLISSMGQFYSTRIVFESKNKRKKYIKIYDSLKIIPFSVEVIAKAFNLPLNKLELDYDTYRAPGHELTEHEVAYLRGDVTIVAMALQVLFDQGLEKITQGSNALFDYKRTVGEKTFNNIFPVPDYDEYVRHSYKGGFTYVKPEYRGKDIRTGLVFDVNSLYPSVMYDCKLPYGAGVYFVGEYEPDPIHDVYVQTFICHFRLKAGHIPTLQIKGVMFNPTEYLISSLDDNGYDQEVTLCMTSVDLELFKEHYDVDVLQYIDGWKFRSTDTMFRAYIDKWMKVKIESTINGNKGMRTLAKLMLNALYGKFALNPKVQSKIVYYEDGIVKYKDAEPEMRKPIYIPVGTFITAYARRKTIETAQRLYKYFVYADTDSLHLDIDVPESIMMLSDHELENLTIKDLQAHGLRLPDDFDVDPVKLGAWKLESKFYRARFLRQKSYIEDNNPPETWGGVGYDAELLKITCAGMPKDCYQHVTWENFIEGSTFPGKLQPKQVHGGVVLRETDFTIKYDPVKKSNKRLTKKQK